MSIAHQPCPKCGSTDALLINDDGSTKCFSCDTFTPSKEGGESQGVKEKELSKEFLKGISKEIEDRNKRSS